MRAFIFDMDGVIIDSEPLHSKIKLKTLQKYGLVFSEERLTAYMGRSTKELFSDVLQESGRKDIDIQEMVDYKHHAYLEVFDDDAVEPIDGISWLLEKLKADGVKTGLASSAGRVIIDAVLNRFGFCDAFDAVVSGAELKRSKPDPEIYIITAERLGVKPAECVVLEDAASGIAAAKAAGMYCIAYRNPNSGKQDLSKADEIVSSVRDIDIMRYKEVLL